jgi:predicted nuclease with TOPRIM domain
MTNQTINKKMSSINWKKMYQKTFAEKKVLKKENQKLKEEIEKLKEVVPENIKTEWRNIYECLLNEEDNCYRQEGFDPELETYELEDGYTYTSMRRMNDWIYTTQD